MNECWTGNTNFRTLFERFNFVKNRDCQLNAPLNALE